MTKLVSLSEVAYAKLSQLKSKNMSFSDVILKLLNQSRGKRDISEFAGILADKGKELDEFEAMIYRDRRRNFGRKIEW